MRARASSYWSALPPWSASVRVHAPARCVWLMGVWWLHKQKQRGCTHAVRCGQWVHRGPRVRAVRVWLVRHVRAVGCVCPRLRMCLYDRDWDKKTPSPSRPLCCGGPRPMMWWTWIHTARQQSCWTLRFKACGRAACCWSQQQTWPTCAGTTGAHWLQCTGPCAHDPKCACVRACVCVCVHALCLRVSSARQGLAVFWMSSTCIASGTGPPALLHLWHQCPCTSLAYSDTCWADRWVLVALRHLHCVQEPALARKAPGLHARSLQARGLPLMGTPEDPGLLTPAPYHRLPLLPAAQCVLLVQLRRLPHPPPLLPWDGAAHPAGLHRVARGEVRMPHTEHTGCIYSTPLTTRNCVAAGLSVLHATVLFSFSTA